jgi:hypothetical protein
MEIKFYMHVWRKKFGGVDKKKLQKMRIIVCRHTVCCKFASQIIFPWVGEAILL